MVEIIKENYVVYEQRTPHGIVLAATRPRGNTSAQISALDVPVGSFWVHGEGSHPLAAIADSLLNHAMKITPGATYREKVIFFPPAIGVWSTFAEDKPTDPSPAARHIPIGAAAFT